MEINPDALENYQESANYQDQTTYKQTEAYPPESESYRLDQTSKNVTINQNHYYIQEVNV